MSRMIALLIALTVALTSQAFALARGQAVAAGEMVICAGGGFVTVAVDAEGRPTGPAHFCPDAVVALAGLAQAPVVAPRPMVPVAVVDAVAVAVVTGGVVQGIALARGPPVLV
jgi:hypothetical protein